MVCICAHEVRDGGGTVRDHEGACFFAGEREEGELSMLYCFVSNINRCDIIQKSLTLPLTFD